LRFVFFLQNRRDQGLALSRLHATKRSVNPRRGYKTIISN
jgi:hypothetical protein